MIPERPSSKIDLGRVVTRTMSVLVKRWAVVTPFALLLAIVPSGFTELAQRWFAPRADGQPLIFWLILTLVASWLTNFILKVSEGAVAPVVIATLNDSPIDLRAIGRAWLRSLPVLVVIGATTAFAATVGLALLILPAFILSALFVVAAPAAAMEGRGVVGSLQRSVALTRGNRARLFWFAVLLVVIVNVASYLVRSAAMIPLSTQQMDLKSAQATLFVSLWLMRAAEFAFVSVSGTVIYAELRTAREGLAPNSLAAVFD